MLSGGIEATGAKEKGSAMKGSLVMVVDDDEIVRHALTVFLTRAGYHVDEAVDGFDAVARLKARRYDAIITDYRMPRLNGIELAAIGWEIQPEIPIIVLSGESSTFTTLATEAGAYAWLCKPINPGQLLQLLRAAIQDSATLSPSEHRN